jgi:hypothetical protein
MPLGGRSITLNRDDYRNLNRRHVVRGIDWGADMGTDYWLLLNPALDLAAASSATDPPDAVLAAYGWTATSLVNTAGSGADFGSSSDLGTPNHLLTNASGDLLNSPAVFGDYAHMKAAADMAGTKTLPRYLIARFFGSMTVHSADEPRSGWGFIEDGGSAATEADQLAFISSDGTNFQIGANAGTPINLLADDALWHEFEIRLDRREGVVEAAIDGVFYLTHRSSTTLAITGDEFPAKFGFHALTTNRPGLGLTHVFYDW